jgi:hypothetical protein
VVWGDLEEVSDKRFALSVTVSQTWLVERQDQVQCRRQRWGLSCCALGIPGGPGKGFPPSLVLDDETSNPRASQMMATMAADHTRSISFLLLLWISVFR